MHGFDPTVTENSADAALRRAELQSVVFASLPKRVQLLRAATDFPAGTEKVCLRVHRNHPFEFIASLFPAFVAYADYDVAIELGDYDDSLNFALDADADIELIWLDYTRYKVSVSELLEWLAARIEVLSSRANAPILVADWADVHPDAVAFNQGLNNLAKKVSGVRVLPISQIAEDLGSGFVDNRMSEIGATRLSERANVTLARLFGLVWLPSVLRARLKAVVFDLDNTLWGGVLGEDGPKGIILTGGYQKLHETALDLAKSGLFLGVLSRNQPEDVVAVFDAKCIGLTLGDFSATSVSWEKKSTGMRDIAEKLRIGFDSILFVDDNPGELAAVAAECPGIKLLRATDDPEETCRALNFFPGLHSWGVDEADLIRSEDLASNDIRAGLRMAASDEVDYLAALQLKLKVTVDPMEHRERLQQLSVKTNQFNLALQRLSDRDVDSYLTAPDKHSVAIWMSDRFSDSGLIAAVFLTNDGKGTMSVDELCVSCRALGRGVEDAMIVAAIDATVDAQGENSERVVSSIRFSTQKGPRNRPALKWLSKFSGTDVTGSEIVSVDWSQSVQVAKARSTGINIEKGNMNAD